MKNHITSSNLSIIKWLLLMIGISFSALGSAAQAIGTITDMDLQNRTIEIDKHPYHLADLMRITGPEGGRTTQAALKIGQRIEFEMAQKQDSSNKLIDKIQIKTLFDQLIKY